MHNPPESTEAAKSRKIIDHVQLQQITEKLFARLPIHIIENNQKNSGKVLRYMQPQLEILHQLPPAQGRTLLLEKDDNAMTLECTVVSRTERGTEILKPIRLYLMKRGIRHENRVEVPGGSAHAGLVQNCIPQNEFYRVNATAIPARDQLLQQYAKAIRDFIPETVVKIEMQKASRLSVRMKKLQDFNLPIYAPKMIEQRQGDDQTIIAMPYSEFEQVMRSDGLPNDYIGEICEPVRYRGVMIIGYVLIHSTRAALNVSQYHAVRQLTRRLERDLDQRKCYPQNTVTGKIVDIMSGAENGDRVVFDAQFSSDNATTFAARVMNRSTQENGMRFGMEFENLSEENNAALLKILS
jgi:hypothetical protein